MGVKNVGAVVQVTLTGFRKRNDVTVYIPQFYPTLNSPFEISL